MAVKIVVPLTDQSHKSHNSSNKYPTIHHFVTEMCTHAHISATKYCIVGYEDCIVGFVKLFYQMFETMEELQKVFFLGCNWFNLPVSSEAEIDIMVMSYNCHGFQFPDHSTV